MTDEEDRRAAELLGKGHPGGPRLDRIWERVEKQVVAAPVRKPWWQAMALMFTPLAAAVAVWALGVMPHPTDEGLTERGGEIVPPQLQASCGTPESPCKVGTPIYLRLLPRHVEGVVVVRTRSADGKTQPVAGPLSANPSAPMPLPARLMPDATDVEKGLDVEAVWLLSAADDVEKAPADARSVLHLTVTP